MVPKPCTLTDTFVSADFTSAEGIHQDCTSTHEFYLDVLSRNGNTHFELSTVTRNLIQEPLDFLKRITI
jgi:hypothetical protein